MFVRVPTFPFLFYFVSEMNTKISQYSYGKGGTNMLSERNPSDLEYADNVVLLSEDLSKSQTFLDHVKDGVSMFGTHFLPSNCEMLLQNWAGSKPNLFLAEDRFS